MAARIDRGYHNLSKTISFWPFFRVTFKWTHPNVPLKDFIDVCRDILFKIVDMPIDKETFITYFDAKEIVNKKKEPLAIVAI